MVNKETKITDPVHELLIQGHFLLYHNDSKTWEWPYVKYDSTSYLP